MSSCQATNWDSFIYQESGWYSTLAYLGRARHLKPTKRIEPTPILMLSKVGKGKR